MKKFIAPITCEMEPLEYLRDQFDCIVPCGNIGKIRSGARNIDKDGYSIGDLFSGSVPIQENWRNQIFEDMLTGAIYYMVLSEKGLCEWCGCRRPTLICLNLLFTPVIGRRDDSQRPVRKTHSGKFFDLLQKHSIQEVFDAMALNKKSLTFKIVDDLLCFTDRNRTVRTYEVNICNTEDAK